MERNTERYSLSLGRGVSERSELTERGEVVNLSFQSPLSHPTGDSRPNGSLSSRLLLRNLCNSQLTYKRINIREVIIKNGKIIWY